MAPTYLETLSHFTTFLTAYTHTLLYHRTLYPPTSFVRSRFHNAAVYQSRHPLVCEWIADAITAVREELLKGSVSKIGIVIFTYDSEREETGSAKIMERYMFDVSDFPVVARQDRNMEIEFEQGTPEIQDFDDDGVMKRRKTKPLDGDVDVNLSEQFRAALLALTTRTSVLAPLPPNCSFNISMELKDEGDIDPPIGHPQAWVPVQPSLQKTGRSAMFRDEFDEEAFELGIRREKEGADLGGAKVTPVRSVHAGVFRFENWIEEGKAKFASTEEDSSKSSFSSF
jgi:mitotic spindle assembly checkpoint protein MAD2B